MTSPTGDEHIRIDAWVPVTAEDVRYRTFRETTLGRRGYRTDEVDQYLARIAGEIERWNRALAEANAEVNRLKNYFRNQGIDTGRAPGAPAEDPAESAAILAVARARAEHLVAAAQAQAQATEERARSYADALVAQARREADELARARLTDDEVTMIQPVV